MDYLYNRKYMYRVENFFHSGDFSDSVIAGLGKGSFKNHVDNGRWVGGLKFAFFVHV